MVSTNHPTNPFPRTLIADDQPDVLAALRLLLKGEGFETETANSPEAVINALSARDFDLVLMDLNYARDTTSGMEGLDLISRIHMLDNTLPVIAMTAWGSIDLAVEAMSRGVCDFVLKPWENARLVETLRRHGQAGFNLRALRRAEALEQADARETQRRLLPQETPHIPGLEIATAWHPARAVGGDYFDLIRFDDSRLAFCIGDVMGKGTPAALLMASTRTAVRGAASREIPPQELCRKINSHVYEDVSGSRFVTLFYGDIDMNARRLSYTNAGHNPPLLVRQGGQISRLMAGGMPLGAFPQADYEQSSVSLQPGDRFLFFTDGLTEVCHPEGEEFGEDRLIRLLMEHRGESAAVLRENLMNAVSDFSLGRFEDDTTLMVIAVE